MQSTHPEARFDRTPAAIGIVLVVLGVVALALRQAGVDVVGYVRGAGWQFFIVVPGLVLLALSIVPAPPKGVGFAIAGSIVTTVGLLLLYQERAAHFESWAYAWALIPTAAGLGMFVYGFMARTSELTLSGLRTAAISAGLFVAGAWFFETIFDTGRAPVDVATWWPVIVIAVGVLVALTALIGRPQSSITLQGDLR